MKLDLSVLDHHRVVDAAEAEVRRHGRLEEDRVAGLLELVGRDQLEIAEHLEIGTEVLLQGLAAADDVLEAHERRIRGVLLVHEQFGVFPLEEPDLPFVEFLPEAHRVPILPP